MYPHAASSAVDACPAAAALNTRPAPAAVGGRLALQGLLLIGGHVWLGRCHVAYALRLHGLRYRWCGDVLLLWRLDSGLDVGVIRVGGIGEALRCQ